MEATQSPSEIGVGRKIWDFVRPHSFTIDPIRVWHTFPLKGQIRQVSREGLSDRNRELNTLAKELIEKARGDLSKRIKRNFSPRVCGSLEKWIDAQSTEDLWHLGTQGSREEIEQFGKLGEIQLCISSTYPVLMMMMQAIHVDVVEKHLSEKRAKLNGGVTLGFKSFANMAAYTSAKAQAQAAFDEAQAIVSRRQKGPGLSKLAAAETNLTKARQALSAFGEASAWEAAFSVRESEQTALRSTEAMQQRNLEKLSQGGVQIDYDPSTMEDEDWNALSEVFVQHTASDFEFPEGVLQEEQTEALLGKILPDTHVDLQSDLPRHPATREIANLGGRLATERERRLDALKFWIYYKISVQVVILIAMAAIPDKESPSPSPDVDPKSPPAAVPEGAELLPLGVPDGGVAFFAAENKFFIWGSVNEETTIEFVRTTMKTRELQPEQCTVIMLTEGEASEQE